MGLPRRFLNLIVDNRIHGAKSLRRIDLARHKLFDTPAPALPPPPPNSEGEATLSAAGDPENIVPAIRLPDPIVNFRCSATDAPWHLDCFPLAGGSSKVICADQSGRAAFFDADTRRAETMPHPHLHEHKFSPLAVFVPSAGDDGHDGGGGGSLYIMDTHPHRELGDDAARQLSTQFEAFVYRRPTSTTSFTGSWQHHLLPRPPFVNPKYFVRQDNRPVISSLAVVGGGSQVCVSVDSAGTYCLDTATHAWTKVGEWTLPFVGRVEYVPELKLWFGICAGDLSAMDSPPQLVGAWKEFEAPPEWKWTELQVPLLVSLGSGRFCVARFFHAVNVMAHFFPLLGLEDGDMEYFTVFTGADVVPCVHGGNGTANGDDTCRGDANVSKRKVELEMIRHNSRRHMSYGSDGNIKLVF